MTQVYLFAKAKTVDVCLGAMGRPKKNPTPRTPLVGVVITPETREQIDEAVRDRRMETGETFNISRFIREAISEKLARDGKAKKLSPLAQVG
jgi:hypothetical protein